MTSETAGAVNRPPQQRLVTRNDWLVAAAAGLVVGLVYLRGAAPGVLPGDSGEFQFAAWLAGLPHPTGYPLYMLLGWAWSHLLVAFGWTSPAGAMNLLSAVLAGLAIALAALFFIVLAETMSEPPEGWVNLSLIARALLGAQDASLSLRDGVNATVEATLEAECSSDADADELAKMLESLNGLGRTALRSSRSESSQAWAHALETGFSVHSDGEKTIARWQLPEALLEKAIAP